MPIFVHIIVEQRDGHWSAWFSGRPQLSCGGQWPAQAIQRLLDGHGGNEFDAEEIVSLDDATNDGHLEFLVPSRHRLRIPRTSLN